MDNNLTKNQEILARIHTAVALRNASKRSVLTPQQRLLQALEEAIEDKRSTLAELDAGSGSYWVTLEQIMRWEEARRLNR